MAMRDTSTPYILQAPADIAEKYGGNKKAIAQAARNGSIDPTAAVLAGMFIDRMRGAQAMEQSDQQTVADKTFAPPPQPAGLGTTPEAQVLASAMPAPGAPPPIRTPEPQVPVQAADGGLMGLNVPDNMYDYAGGGIVAFASAGDTGSSKERNELLRQVAVKFKDNMGVLRALDKMSVDDLRKLMAFDESAAPAAPTAVASPVQSPLAAQVTEPVAAISNRGGADVGEIPGVTTGPFAAPVAAPAVTDQGPVANTAEPGGTGFRLPGQSTDLGETLFATPDAAIQSGATVPEQTSSGLAKYVDQYRALMPPESEDIKALRDYYKGAPERLQKQKMEDIWTAVTMGGLGALSESRPSTGSTIKDILGTLGVAGKYGMPQITEGLKTRRAGEEAAMKSRAELARMDRAEQAEALKGGVTLYGKELEREAQLEAARIAAGKGTDMRNYVDNYVAAARAKGDDKTPEPVLRQQGGEKYLALYGASQLRGTAAASQAETAATKAGTEIQDKARDNVDARLSKNYNDPDNRKIRELQKQDRANKKEGKETNLAGDYIKGLYTNEEARMRNAQSGGAKPAPKAEPKPTAAPQQAPKGKFEVKAPNGKVYYFQTKEQANAFANSFGAK